MEVRNEDEFNDLCGRIKLIVSEIDGVITDGLSQIDPVGTVVSKQYFLPDIEAINDLKKTFKFVFMSSSNDINWAFCNKRQIPFFFAKRNKFKELLGIARRYNVQLDEILYVGSKLSDMECVSNVPLSVCTWDSPPALKKKAFIVLDALGASGVFYDVMEVLSMEILNRKLNTDLTN